MSIYSSVGAVTSGLVFNFDAASIKNKFVTNLIPNRHLLATYPANQNVTVTQNGEWFQAVSNQSTSTPGVYPIGGSGTISVLPSTRYTFRIYMYTASGSNVSLYGYSSSGTQVFYDTASSATPGWVERTFTTGASDTWINVGFLWSGSAVGSTVRFKDVGLYRTDLLGDSINGLGITAYNTPTITNTVTFNGTNQYLAITNNAALRPSTELTIETVLKASSITATWKQLLGYGQADYTNGNYLLFLESDGSAIRCLSRVNNTEYRCNTNQTVSTSAYKHVVFTMKTGDAIRSYFNGSADITTTLPSGTFTYNGTASPYQVGCPGGGWYAGELPYMRIYNRQLSAAEVLQNFSAIRGRFGL